MIQIFQKVRIRYQSSENIGKLSRQIQAEQPQFQKSTKIFRT